MTALERLRGKEDRRSLFSKKPLAKKFKRVFGRGQNRFTSIRLRYARQRVWRQHNLLLFRRQNMQQQPSIVWEAPLLAWLESYLQDTISQQQQKSIAFSKVVYNLTACRDFLSLYAGEDLHKQKDMLQELSRLRWETRGRFVSNWEEALVVLRSVAQLEETLEEAAPAATDETEDRPVRDWVRRWDEASHIKKGDGNDKSAISESKLMFARIIVQQPANSRTADYDAQDALLEEQLLAKADDTEEAGDDGEIAIEPLTPEQQAQLYEAIEEGPEIVAKIKEDTVQRRSLSTLLPGEWVNDEVIHCYMQMLSSPGQHFFKSFFMTKLLNEGDLHKSGQYEYRNVKRWSKKVEGMYLGRVLFVSQIFHNNTQEKMFSSLTKSSFPSTKTMPIGR